MKLQRRCQQGFTLVELAVVMVIIGVLIGGVLKGQELIENSRLSALTGQIKAIEAATNGFYDKYGQDAGDLSNPGGMLSGCTTNNRCVTVYAPVTDSNEGDGIIQANIGKSPASAVVSTEPSITAQAGEGEGYAFFAQLLVSGYLTGYSLDGNGVTAGGEGFGQTNPLTTLGGGIFVGDTRLQKGIFGFNEASLLPRPYLVVTSQFSDMPNTDSLVTPAASGGLLSPLQASVIDRRIDDKDANNGSFVVDNENGCRAGTVDENGTDLNGDGDTTDTNLNAPNRSGNYAVTNTAVLCAVAYKI